jgi:hypothetical protein
MAAGRRGTRTLPPCTSDGMAATPTVDFAYPTTRRYDNMNEGKPGVRAVLGARAAPSTTRDWLTRSGRSCT